MNRNQQLAFLEQSPDASSLPADLILALLDGLPGIEQATQWVRCGERYALARASARRGDSFVLASSFYQANASRELIIAAEQAALQLAHTLASAMKIPEIRRSPQPDPTVAQVCDHLYGRPDIVHQWRVDGDDRKSRRSVSSVIKTKTESGLEVYNRIAMMDDGLDAIPSERLRSMDAKIGRLTAAVWRAADGTALGVQIAAVINREVHLLAIAVHPRHRCRGIGSALQNIFINDHTRSIRSDVLNSNRAAVRFHLSQGFKRGAVEHITWRKCSNSCLSV